MHAVLQVIRTANAEVAKGLQNPLYKLLQRLPGPPSKGQRAITTFHSMMDDLLQEVKLDTVNYCPHLLEYA